MTPSTLEDAINRQTHENIALAVDMAHATLVTNSVNAKLPESIFKQLFLPILSAQATIENNTNLYKYWVSVAGSPSASIDVVSDQDRSTVLFTLPPVINTSQINHFPGSTPISEITINAQMHSKHIPIEGTRYEAKHMSEKAKEIRGNSSHQNTREQLITIMGRYGIKPPQQQQQLSNTPIEDDYFDL